MTKPKREVPKGTGAPPFCPQPFVPPAPFSRSLRTFSVDPALATQLDTALISEVTLKVPWEQLEPGPVGEYLEVIDVDPASGCFYEPIALDVPALLAQDGLAPSEGTPQFHQQMVYAVASLTIRNFERALGRRALWRPGLSQDARNPRNDGSFVRRLRVYPHALRERNAYYSPDKVALLFGYFNAGDDDPADHMPGSMVFTCLSHDVIAHETTHALLDGMHRRLLRPTNHDVRAFHEAFADIVALFQHFTFAEILRQQIAATRGELRTQQNLLGQLAGQFGRSTGLRGALRDAIGGIDESGQWQPHKPDPQEYELRTEPHARGAILVAAVFDAFLSIYERRTADLLRLASEGTGVLRPGAVHPDLVGRLAADAAKTAQHVLTMCIRALDYCPPVDITFGEFLRALITADVDTVANDDLNYRVAFIEAFRKRGIYPRDVRTLSVESLVWRGPRNDQLQPSATLGEGLRQLQERSREYLFEQSPSGEPESRENVFDLQRALRSELHRWLSQHFEHHAHGAQDAAFLGIDRERPFEVHTARYALRAGPEGDVDPQLLVGLLQEITVPVDPADVHGPTMPFEGGCTIVADLRRLKIRYCIRKRATSAARLLRQQQAAIAHLDTPRASYMGASFDDTTEPFAALHRGLA
jgi:hypothetical protein